MAKTKTNVVMRAIAFLLSLLMTFYAIPSVIYAEFSEAISSLSSDSASDSDKSTSSDVPIYEAENLREENVKTFCMPDGSYVAAVYPTAVHRQDELGVWQDINNTLLASGSEYVSGDARVKFAKKITGNGSLFTLHENNTKITLSLVGAIKKTPGEVIKEKVEDDGTELGKLMTLENLNSTIIYRDVLSGVDVEYVLTSNDIKENIIVKEKSEEYVYVFTLKLNNLTATLTESGDVLIMCGDKQAYEIPAPVIYDANGVYADTGVGLYTLTDNGGGSYTLTVTANSEWMNSADRAFPVTVDPTLQTVGVTQYSTTVNYGNTDTISQLRGDINLTGYSDLDEYATVGYWKESNIYFLPRKAYITGATVSFYAMPSTNANIAAYQVMTSWSDTENPGLVGDRVLSYCTVFKDVDQWVTFDITEAVKEWDADKTTNYGIAFKLIGSDGRSTVKMRGVSNENHPIFQISYRNLFGLEDYLTYSSHSIGAGATGHVNLAMGNLTLAIPTLTTTDSLMSFTPTLYYNSSMLGKYNRYMHAQVPYSMRSAGLGFKWNMQQSVILVHNNEIASDAYYVWSDGDGTEHALKYEVDEDGYYHIVDEDGLQLECEDKGSTFTITDRSGTVMTFNEITVPEKAEDILEAWTLSSITDNIGNKLIFGYDDHYRPTSVNVQPFGESKIGMLGISYRNGVPYYVNNIHSGERVYFRYSEEYDGEVSESSFAYLREVEYQTNSNVTARLEFDYNYEGLILGAKESVSDYEIEYQYRGKRIKSVTEYGDGDEGQAVYYTYGNRYTDVRTSGNDDEYGTSDDIITRHILDNMGRAITAYSKDAGNSKLYGSTSVEYAAEENIKNNLTGSSTVEGLSTNCILNGDFDSYSESDKFIYWIENGNVSRSLSDSYIATFALQTNATFSIAQEVFVRHGRHTLSFNLFGNKADGAVVELEILSLNDLSTVKKEIAVANTDDGEYERVSFSFDVKNADKYGDRILITFSVKGGETVESGASVSIDDVALTRESGLSSFSMVEGGNFETVKLKATGAAAIHPSAFWQTEGHDYKSEKVDNSLLHYAYRLDGKVTAENYGYQRIYEISAEELADESFTNEGRTYTVSGFAKADGAAISSKSKFRIVIVVGSIPEDDRIGIIEIPYDFNFNPSCEDWQFVSGSFRIADGERIKNIAYIDVYLEYSYQPTGTYALFDEISVIECDESATSSYIYYKNGNLKTAISGSYYEYYEYDENNNVIKMANSAGDMYEYVYTDKSLLSEERYYTCRYGDSREYPYYVIDIPSTEEIESPEMDMVRTPISKTNYEYNSYGQCTKVTSYGFDEDENATKPTVTTYTYSATDSIFGAQLTETDANGTTLRHYYDTSNGRLLATVNEDSGDGYAYIYDAQGRLSGVRPATYSTDTTYSTETNAENVIYTYDERNLLSTITTDTTTYTFFYDSFGNSTSVKAGNNTIASYEYNEYNGKLKKLTYANGLVEEYVYNALEMLEEVWYTVDGNKTLAYKYSYSSNGALIEFENCLTGDITRYTYSAEGNLIAESTYNENDELSHCSVFYSYDKSGDLLSCVSSAVSYLAGNEVYESSVLTEYSYTDDDLLDFITVTFDNFEGEIGYTYDGFNRITKKSSLLGGYIYDVEIEYEETENTTLTRVHSYKSTVGTRETVYTYTYDDNGNITCISYGGENEITYEYDNLGQLKRENNTIINRTYTYEYDNAGNIILKSEYAYTPVNVEPTELIYSYTYVYSNGAWGDQLVSFNGNAIDYDALGNPTSYYNGADFDWIGRRLVGAIYNGKQMSFTYDDNGIRQSKTVNGVTTNYYWSGSMLIAEETDGECIVYLYDDTGAPIGFRYRKSTYAEGAWDSYFYEKNLQGDIIAVFDF
ncbi:MAG: hypothetical protein J6V09_01055, partial [Clostridia bacterium]|nr:hypothetical protein [Clostridia bacterium]